MSQPSAHDTEVPVAAEVDIDVELARRLVGAQMPEYRDLPVRRVSSIGTDNAVFRLGDDLAIRMPLRQDTVGGLLKEVRWLPAIAPHLSLSVPQVVSLGEPDERYPLPWAVVRWLEGEDALSGRFDSMGDTARALGRFVNELQHIDMSDAPPPGSEGFVRGLPIDGRDAAFRAGLAQCRDHLDVRRVGRVWDLALSAPGWDGTPVWLHADLLPGNLLVRDGRLAGILDFGAMATGDPAYDVTPAWHLFDHGTRSLFLDTLGVAEATWHRARGLVIAGGVIGLSYYLGSNPFMVAAALSGIQAVLDDPA